MTRVFLAAGVLAQPAFEGTTVSQFVAQAVPLQRRGCVMQGRGCVVQALVTDGLVPLVLLQVLLIEHDIPTREFSAAVMACLPSPTYSCAPVPGSGRVDLRHLDVCSIDPPGCKVRWLFPDRLLVFVSARSSPQA